MKVSIAFLLVFSVLSLRNGMDEPLVPFSAELSLIGLFVALVYVLIKRAAGGGVSVNSSQKVFILLLFALFFLALSSAFWSSYVAETIVRSFLFIGVPLLYLIIVLLDKPNPEEIIKYFVSFSVVMVCVGIFILSFGEVVYSGGAWINRYSLFGYSLSQPHYSNNFRLASLVGNSNLLGLYAGVSIGLCFWLAAISAIGRYKLFTYIAILIVGVLLSQSRAAIGFALLSGAIGLFLMKGITFMRLVVASAISMIVFLGIAWYVASQQHLFDRFSAGVNDRDIAWGIISPRLSESAIWGHGFGSVTEFLAVENGVSIGAHSLYYTLAYELGLIGCALFFVLVVMALFDKARRMCRADFIIFSLIILFLGHQIVEVQILKFNLVNIIFLYLCFTPVWQNAQKSYAGRLDRYQLIPASRSTDG